MAELLNVTPGNDAIASYTHGSATDKDRIRIGNAEVSGNYGNYITRVQFTTNANGATSLSFDFTHGYWLGSGDLIYKSDGTVSYKTSGGYEYSMANSFKYAITTADSVLISHTDTLRSDAQGTADALLDAAGYVIKNQPVLMSTAQGRAENSGHITSASEAKKIASFKGTCNVLLEPNKTYYLWLYSAYNQTVYLKHFLFTGYGHNGYIIVNSEGSYYKTLTYNDNGGTGGPGSQQVVTAQSFTLSDTKPTKADTNGYTVTFNGNGGAVSPTSRTAKDSYTFSSWNMSQDGSGYSYLPEQTLDGIDVDTTIYAQYTQTKGSVALPTPTRSGYTFKGWAASSSASSGVTGNYTPTSNITLYATWQIKTYTLTLNKGTGVASFTGAGTYNYAANASTTATAAIGYHLTKYAGTLADGSGTEEWPLNTTNTTPIKDNNTWAMYANRTITAYATANTYIITYDSNGGTGTMENSTATYNANFLTRANTYGKTGHQFNGWNEAADGTGIAWTLQSLGVYEHGLPWTWTYVQDITLYAQWNPNTYYIQYNSNGGTGTMANSTHRYGIFSNLTKNAFSRAGYKFKGWATSSTATTAIYSDGHSISTMTAVNGEIITLYAVWAQDVFTVTTGAEGTYTATVNGGGNYSYGDTCTIEAIYPEGCGYEFSHFIKNGTTTITSNPYSETVTAEASFIAYSQPIQYIIQFNGNMGEGSMSSMICKYDTDYSLISNAFRKDGYQFIGWSTSSNATTVTYENGQTIRNLASNNGSIVTLYAVWKAISKVYIWAANAAGEYGWRKALKYIYNTQLVSNKFNITIDTSSPSNFNYTWLLFDSLVGDTIANGTYVEGNKTIAIDKSIYDNANVVLSINKESEKDTIIIVDHLGNELYPQMDDITGTFFYVPSSAKTLKIYYSTAQSNLLDEGLLDVMQIF